ncbi:MAG: ABC transporter ATP-binding protein [Opitutaceae bacterium]
MSNSAPLLSIRGLTKRFRSRAGFFSRRTHEIHALEDVSLDIPRGATLGLVGESGSGKTTLGRCILKLTTADRGAVIWNEEEGGSTDLLTLRARALRGFRRRMQVVFQDPFHSLNPTRLVWQIVGERLFIDRAHNSREIRDRAAQMLASVGLRQDCLDRLPHEFSGGQRQRIAIARALIVEPEFLVCDEVTSALDTRTQAQVLELLREIQARSGITLLFISHDLHTVASMSREVVVMHAGKIVEHGTPAQIFREPAASYTRRLVQAVPHPDPRQRTFRPA